MTPMLFAALLAAQIGAALGEEQSLHSAELPRLAEHASCKGLAALRLENVRLRRRLAKTERALEAVSHKAQACAAEAQQCSELLRAFADLESVNKELRQAIARLRQKGGIECSLHFPHRLFECSGVAVGGVQATTIWARRERRSLTNGYGRPRHRAGSSCSRQQVLPHFMHLCWATAHLYSHA